MKRTILTYVFVMIMGLLMAQQDSVVNGVLQYSPHSFMVLPANPSNPTQNDWVKCWYVTSTPDYSYQDASWVQGINYPNTYYTTHRVYTASNSTQLEERDCYSCRQLDGQNYMKNYKFPPLWDSDTVTGGRPAFESQYMQLFGPRYSYDEPGNNAQGQKIEYKFKVSEDRSVLLLNFSYIMQHADYHVWNENPYIDIQLLNANGQQLDLGYYPNDYKTKGNLHAGDPAYNNTNWPYSRFFVEVPDATNNAPAKQTPSTLPNTTYSFVTMDNCPPTQVRSGTPKDPSYSDSYEPVRSYPYTIIAFNLSDYIGQTVILRFVAMGCGQSIHFAYARFTAKMVPHKILVKYCSGDENMQLIMPWGFDESHAFKAGSDDMGYQWFNGTDSAHAQWFDPTDVNDPRVVSGSTQYRPILQPDPAKPYYRCDVTSQTGVPFQYEATVNYYDLQPAFTAQPRALTDHPDCSYTVEVTNTSKIGVIVPDGNGGVDTNWQDLTTHGDQCTWNWGDGTPEETGFHPTHTYTQPGTYTISLHITDFERICVSYDTTFDVTIGSEFMEKQYAEDEATTCEGKLPYYYKPEIFGTDNTQTRWDLNAVGERTVNYSYALPQYNIRSWNGCDSIVKVQFDVLTPSVIIDEVPGQDFCDSAQTMLEATAFNVSDDIKYEWVFMDSIVSTTNIMTALSDGTYAVTVVDNTTDCSASTTYKIDACVPNVFLPNCITPTQSANQGPAQNDYLYLDEFVLRFISDLKISIYARNGEQVYYYEGKKNAGGTFEPTPAFVNVPEELGGRLILWDGKVKGRVISGVYSYALWIVSGGQTYLYKGKLTVL